MFILGLCGLRAPRAIALRPPHASREEVVSTCINGSICSRQGVRHVGRVLCVYRARPHDDEEYARPDEDVRD